MAATGEFDSTTSTEVVRGEGRRTIRLAGELDGAAALDLRALLDDVELGEWVEVDASALTFVDSMGLRLMVEWHRQLQDVGGQVVIRTPSEPLEALLQVTQLDKVLVVERSSSGVHPDHGSGASGGE